MSLGAILAGRAFIDVIARDKYSKALGKAEAKLRAFGAGVAKVGAGMLGGASAVGGALFAITKGFATSGAALDDMSKRTGASVEALSELSFAAGQSGSSIEDVEISLKKMQDTVTAAAGGTKAAVAALAKLGLTAEQLAGLSPDQQMMKLADGLDAIKDPAAKTAAALDVFGKSGTKLLPMLEGGAAGLEALRQTARDAGLVMTTEMAQSAAKLDDGFDALWRTIGGVANQIGAALAPALTEIIRVITPVIADVGKWIAQNPELVVALGAATVAVGALGAAAIALGATITAVGTVIGALLSPITLVVAAIAGLVTWFLLATEEGAKLREVFGETFTGIMDSLMSGNLELAGRIAWAGLKAGFIDMIASLREEWEGYLRFLGPVGRTMLGISDMVLGTADQMRANAQAIREELQLLTAQAARARGLSKQPLPGQVGPQEAAAAAAKSDAAAQAEAAKRGPAPPTFLEKLQAEIAALREKNAAAPAAEEQRRRMAAGVKSASSVGTFSAAGAARLAGSLETESRKAAVASEKHLRKLIRLQERERGGTFT